MNTIRMTIAAAWVLAFASLTTAQAIPEFSLPKTYSLGDLSLVAQWDGNSRSSVEAADVGFLIQQWNGANRGSLPLLTDATLLELQTQVSEDTDTLVWTAPLSGFSHFYVLSKYGSGRADWDHALHYVSAGDLISYNPGGVKIAPNGLSHYTVWGVGVSVPDGGPTLLLLCLAVLGLRLVRHRRVVRG